MRRRSAPAAGLAKRSPGAGARPPGRKVRAKPGWAFSETLRAQVAAIIGVTAKPPSARRIAGASRVSNGRVPKRAFSAIQAPTAPGTVTASHPRSGIASRPAKRSGLQPAGERPEALRPCSSDPSQRIAKASEPRPLPVGSTTVSAAAAASAASTALPPSRSISSPAWAASGCEVATTLSAITGERREG